MKLFQGLSWEKCKTCRRNEDSCCSYMKACGSAFGGHIMLLGTLTTGDMMLTPPLTRKMACWVLNTLV